MVAQYETVPTGLFTGVPSIMIVQMYNQGFYSPYNITEIIMYWDSIGYD